MRFIFISLGDALLERLEIKENAFVSNWLNFASLGPPILFICLFYQSQFNLPVRVKGGFLSKTAIALYHFIYCNTGWPVDRLRLKIPWKSKFTDPVIAEVEGLYIIAAPLSGEWWHHMWRQKFMSGCYCVVCLSVSATPYDAKKETKEAHNKKQNQLKKIEEAKKKEKGI